MIEWCMALLRRLGSLFGIGGANAHNDDFDPELREVFFAELEDVRQSLESAFAVWRGNATDDAALKQLRRGFHTIKGAAQMVGATALGDFCRHLEQLAIRLMEKQVKVTPAMVVTVEQAIALLPAFAKTVSDGRAPPPQSHAIANRVQRLLS
jgi:chemosensory pili system protein ChpA (sensor histidine kinase/response regulator)